MPKTWKQLSSKSIYKNKWTNIVEDDVLQPDKNQSIYAYVKRIDGVGIFVLENEYVHLVNQYRYPVKKTLLQIPLETNNPEESNRDAAIRCAKEELGFVVRNVKYIGESFVDAGLNTQKIFFYVAEKVSETKRALEGSEKDLVTMKISVKELDKLVENHTIEDFHTVSGIYYLQKHLLNDQQ